MIAGFLSWLTNLRRQSAFGSVAVPAAVVLLTAMLSMAAVAAIAFLTSADRFVQDWEVATWTKVQPQDPDIVIIAIDDDTLYSLPYRSPIDRAFIGQLLEKLAQGRPRAIGVDLLFDQPTEPAKDEALRRTLQTLNVPLVVSYTDTKSVVTESQKKFLDGFVPPRERAIANIATDHLDIVRWVYPGTTMKDGTYIPSFPRALAAAVGVKTKSKLVALAWHGQPADNIKPFAEYSARLVHDILPAAWFKDKIILIGSDATLVDRHRTPFDSFTRDGKGMAGILIQAHALSQLLHGVKSPLLGPWADFLIAALMATAGAGLGAASFPLIWRVAAGVAVIAVFWVLALLLFYDTQSLVGVMAPSIAAIAAFGGMDSLTGRDARRQREFIHGAFSRYVSPKLVEQLVRDPAKMSLEGERRVMTYLFTDVKDFTTMSEGIDSKELGHILNPYLESITHIVLKYDGMVDKFIGDSVFAIFNAPVDLADHAECAVKCAMEIDRFSHEFSRAQYAAGIPFGITRIGVHTGPAVIGNFGSHARFTYTAQGDSVNTASRLEALNKHLGTRLCISDATRQLCKTIPFRPIASVVLKGKTAAVEVWEPLADGEMSPDYLARYDGAFAKLEQGSPDALALFAALSEESPDDPCVALHLGRLRAGLSGSAIVMTEK